MSGVQTKEPAQDQAKSIAEQVAGAYAERQPLRIVGGDSKAFYGRTAVGQALILSGHRGLTNYEPTELVLTARAGTPLAEIETLLAEQGQMLPFEPPAFGDGATLGGTIACGLSGPRRPYAGAARDLVLGSRVVNGRGESLRFGGEVMKNVAGYDVSRLMTGALGTLGVLLEISIKVLPRPEADLSLSFEMDQASAIEGMNQWSAQPLPVSAAAWHQGLLRLRLSGPASALAAARRKLGGEAQPDDDWWRHLKEQQLAFFTAPGGPLWRLSLLSTAPPLPLEGDWLLDWGGAQRWLRTPLDDGPIRDAVARLDGHASLFRGGDRSGSVFQPLSPGILQLHRRLKQAFDPGAILNPGRLYAGI